MKPVLLGCIADDFTGATDLANNLVRAGMRTVQTIGVPAAGEVVEADAIVVALKSRTIAAADAVAQSLAALRWLQSQGVQQIYFKVCSTFDSTPAGNIGPVAQALMQALGADFALVTPAFPENGRTVFRGHLFVGDQLLKHFVFKPNTIEAHAYTSRERVWRWLRRHPVLVASQARRICTNVHDPTRMAAQTPRRMCKSCMSPTDSRWIERSASSHTPK